MLLFKKMSLCALVFMLCLAGFSQTIITQWAFNTNFGGITAMGNCPAPTIGAGNMRLIGGTTATSATGVAADFGTPNRALNTTDYPPQGTLPLTAGLDFSVSTLGYNNIHIRMYIRNSPSASNKTVVQFLNGIVWQTVGSYTAVSADNFSNFLDFDLSAFTEVNDNLSQSFRFVSDYANGTAYQTPEGNAYGSGGTIRFDLVTVTGNPLTCVLPATIQTSGLQLLESNFTNCNYALTRGNGGGCLVVCRQGALPNTDPTTGINYAANSAYGSGSTVGGGFAVYKTTNVGTQYFPITNLVAGAKYYVAAYEYSAGGFCYLTPAVVDSFICNSTILKPGDLQIVGVDNAVASGGTDLFFIANLVNINPGTNFKLVNSRYEAGAAANTRTNTWAGSSTQQYQPLETVTLTYTGTSPLGAGSVLSFSLNAGVSNIKLNGVATTNFSATTDVAFNMLNTTTPAEFLYLVQGNYTQTGTANVDLVNSFSGNVLHALSLAAGFTAFNNAVAGGSTVASRVPPQVNCLKVSPAGLAPAGSSPFYIAAYFNFAGNSVGTKNFVLSKINTASNWTNLATATAGDDISSVLNQTLSIDPSNPPGTWTGAANGDWFNCNNWEGLTVPDSTTNVVVPLTTNNADINVALGNEYDRLACTKKLFVSTGRVNILANGLDKLNIYDSLIIGSSGFLFAGNNQTDTIHIFGNLVDNNPNVGLQMIAGGLLVIGNRFANPTSIFLSPPGLFSTTQVFGLTINNPFGVTILNGGFESLKQLNLTNGIVSFANNNAFHTIGADCIISSPINLFGEINRGWENSFFDSRVIVKTNNTLNRTAPLGNVSQNIFAPLLLAPSNILPKTYLTNYTAISHPNVAPIDVAQGLDHVSDREYWSVQCNDLLTAAAKLTLYYTPYSRVGDGMAANDAQNLNELRIAQYWDGGSGTNLWRLYGTPGVYNAGSNVNYGKIAYTEFATDLSANAKNFTLASINTYSTLPIQILDWQAKPQGNLVSLHWEVNGDEDVVNYTLEKSTDGIHFSLLQKLSAKQMASPVFYNMVDAAPQNGWNYYRLCFTTKQAKTYTYQIRKLWFGNALRLLVYPNPAKDIINIITPTINATAQLYNTFGKLVLTKNISNRTTIVNVSGLPRGWYILKYFSPADQQSTKIFLY